MDILEWARNEKAGLVSLRRDLHRIPEPAWQEHKTAARIEQELDRLGLPHHRVAGTGIIAHIPGPPGAPVIGLRADIDALPIREANSVPHASTHPGFMHACGHDGHMAILLTAAKILSERRNLLDSSIALIFQPAEEVVAGGEQTAQDPDLAAVSSFVALHLWPFLPVGAISVQPGPRMASADTFEIDVAGQSAHGSMPHLGIDALHAGAQIVAALQSAVSRLTNPLDTAVVTVGTFQSGTAPNIIAPSAKLTGTIRAFSEEVRRALPQQIETIAARVAAAFGATASFRLTPGTPPVINDPACASVAAKCAAAAVGPDGVVDAPPTMGAEDFAHFLALAPGVMAWVGCGNAAKGMTHPLHHECYDFDEDALVHGTAFMVAYAMSAGALAREAKQ